MESADRTGSAFLRVLRSAERLSEAAIRFGSFKVKTPCLRSSASLSRVTRRDQRRVAFFAMFASLRLFKPDEGQGGSA